MSPERFSRRDTELLAIRKSDFKLRVTGIVGDIGQYLILDEDR